MDINERRKQTFGKSVRFEKTGETFSIEISIEKVSPDLSRESIFRFLDTLFAELKDEFLKR